MGVRLLVPSRNIDLSYDQATLFEVMFEFDGEIDADQRLRVIHVNFANRPRDIRLFMHQAFVIGDARSNTGYGAVPAGCQCDLHYRGRRAFIVSGQDDTGAGFDQYSIGLFGIEGRDGTYRDAEDGELSMSPVKHGRVDSTIRFRFGRSRQSARLLLDRLR